MNQNSNKPDPPEYQHRSNPEDMPLNSQKDFKTSDLDNIDKSNLHQNQRDQKNSIYKKICSKFCSVLEFVSSNNDEYVEPSNLDNINKSNFHQNQRDRPKSIYKKICSKFRSVLAFVSSNNDEYVEPSNLDNINKLNFHQNEREEPKSTDMDCNNGDVSSDNEDYDKPSHSNHSKFGFNCDCKWSLGLMCLFVFLIAVIFGIFPWLNNAQPSYQLYEKSFAETQSALPSMNPIYWKVMNRTVFGHVFCDGYKRKPAVINIIGTNASIGSFHREFRRFLLHAKITDECHEFQCEPSDKEPMIRSMDSFLLNLSKKKHPCVFILDIDRMPPSVGPYLHGLTDDDNGKFKNMIYVISIVTDSNLHYDTVANTYSKLLSSVWKEYMGNVRFESLASRLIRNVVGLTY